MEILRVCIVVIVIVFVIAVAMYIVLQNAPPINKKPRIFVTPMERVIFTENETIRFTLENKESYVVMFKVLTSNVPCLVSQSNNGSISPKSSIEHEVKYHKPMGHQLVEGDRVTLLFSRKRKSIDWEGGSETITRVSVEAVEKKKKKSRKSTKSKKSNATEGRKT